MSSAFSDSSMSEDEMSTPFGGLQKYSSYGKHAVGQQEPYQLRKTRPPFSMTRSDSFSSGDDDDEEDGLQEMTAENLFSTLLSRVKSLTRRIHDEHEEHVLWQQKQSLGRPKLNPGGTHARLERTAQRNSIKKDRESAMAAATAASRPPVSYSRQSSQTYGDDSLNRSSGSRYEPTKIYNRSNSYSSNNNTLESDRYSTGTGSRYSTLSGAGGQSKRYDESDGDYSSNISVTSSQRLRPGYLPPPVNINSSDNYNNPSTASQFSNRSSSSAANAATDLDAHTVAQTIISRAQDKAEQRSIPISIQRENINAVSSPSDQGGYSKSYNQPTTRYEDLDSDGYGGRRTSRFLRPDFYDTPKEDSVYSKMKDFDDERSYMRNAAGSRGAGGRITPINDTLSPQYCDTNPLGGGESSGASEGQFRNRSSLTLTRRNSLREPGSRQFNKFVDVDSIPPLASPPSLSNPLSPSPLPQSPIPTYSRMNYTSSELPVENAQLYRRQIRPYTGAKSEGQLLNAKHANLSHNVIAAAERKKRQSQCYEQEHIRNDNTMHES